MAEKHAKTHTNKSNRARDTLERKVVYKSVLDNPFQVRWPYVPDNIQNSLLARIVSFLDGAAEIHHKTQLANRKRKRENYVANVAKKEFRTQDEESPGASMAVDGTSQPDAAAGQPGIDVPVVSADNTNLTPSILDHLTIGINEVTKMLELTAKAQRHAASSEPPEAATQRPSTSRLVAVCLPDINPSVLVGHLPNLVAACNSTSSSGELRRTWLVPLPKGAEQALATAVGLKRVATIAIDGSAPQFSSLEPLLDSIPILTASWLHPAPNARAELIPTHIKQLKTTAPKDMRAAKELRAKGRAEAKRRKQEKVAKLPKRVIVAVS